MLFTPAKQTWPDRFSDSEVVYVPSDKEIKAIQAEFDLTDKPSLANKGKKPKKS
jgi:hypothetical protein